MDFIPAEKTVKIAINGTWSSQKVASTLWFQYGSEPGEGEMHDLAEYMFDSFWPNFISATANSYTLDNIVATRQNNNHDIQAIFTPTSGNVGTGSGASVPLNAAWCFSGRTNQRGRSYRSRNYFPGLLNSILTSPGIGNGTTLAGLGAAVLTYLTTNLPSGWTWVVASHFANKAPRTTAVLTPIISVVVDTALDSMRRRLVGRGT